MASLTPLCDFLGLVPAPSIRVAKPKPGGPMKLPSAPHAEPGEMLEIVPPEKKAPPVGKGNSYAIDPVVIELGDEQLYTPTILVLDSKLKPAAGHKVIARFVPGGKAKEVTLSGVTSSNGSVKWPETWLPTSGTLMLSALLPMGPKDLINPPDEEWILGAGHYSGPEKAAKTEQAIPILFLVKQLSETLTEVDTTAVANQETKQTQAGGSVGFSYGVTGGGTASQTWGQVLGPTRTTGTNLTKRHFADSLSVEQFKR